QEEKLRILEEVNRITKAKVSIGESKEIDYLRSSVEIQKIKTSLFKAGKTIAYEKTKVNEFLNYSLPEDFTIADTFAFSPLPEVEERLQKLIDKSPLIRLKSNRVEQGNAHLKAARFSIIESVELFGEKEKEMEGKIWRVGIGVSIPLFNQKSAHIRKAKLEKEKAKFEFEHAQKHFFADIQRIVAGIRILEKEIDTFKGAILKEGRENMELSETLYKAGEVPLVVFLDSQNSYFEVQERYYEAITEWNLLKAELEELLGEEL
ncbi:MAG: TolC family protein, partial [bacterium]|nr:TolC family protein [bacterium]